MKVSRKPALTAVLLTLLLGACTADGNAPETTGGQGSPLQVVATTTILGDIASTLAGGDLVIDTLMLPSADPHEFQPSSQQVALIHDADLVITNGLGLEEGFLDVIEGAKADGVNVLEVAPLVDPLPFGESGGECDPTLAHEHTEEEAENEASPPGSCDPHFWNDPLRVAAAAELIADALTNIDPSVNWASSASGYAGELRALDSEIESLFGPIPTAKRKLVTNHDSLGYLAHRYGFEVVGVVIPGGSTLAEPSSAELAALVEVMVEEDVRVIFAETISPSVLAGAVADEIGEMVVVVELYTDSLGPPGSGAETVTDMLRLNAERIAAALR